MELDAKLLGYTSLIFSKSLKLLLRDFSRMPGSGHSRDRPSGRGSTACWEHWSCLLGLIRRQEELSWGVYRLEGRLGSLTRVSIRSSSEEEADGSLPKSWRYIFKRHLRHNSCPCWDSLQKISYFLEFIFFPRCFREFGISTRLQSLRTHGDFCYSK